MLDISRECWMPIQHPIRDGKRGVAFRGGGGDGPTPMDVDGEENDFHMPGLGMDDLEEGADQGVWEHRTGHVMVPAKDGLLVIGGLAYSGEFQNDVQHIKVF
jgi:hypothetical protein